MGCHFLLQGIFLTQGLNLGLLPCRRTLYHLSHQGSPTIAWQIEGEKVDAMTDFLFLGSKITAQAGMKIAGRNINSLRYADDTTLMAESEVELNSLEMQVKEENEKAGLKL